MTNPSEAIIEAVARALYGASGYEAERVAGPDCVVPGYDEDDEDAREFCRTLARAAICAMRAICKICVQEFDIATGHACSGQAATPAAPVQDDDAEFLLDLALTMNDIEAAALRRIVARLTPDRPVQDDDAEWLRELAQTADEVEAPRFERIAARLEGSNL